MDIDFNLIEQPVDGASLWGACALGQPRAQLDALDVSLRSLVNFGDFAEGAIGSVLVAPDADGKMDQVFLKETPGSAHEICRSTSGNSTVRPKEITVAPHVRVLFANAPLLNSLIPMIRTKDAAALANRPAPIPFCPGDTAGIVVSHAGTTVTVSHDSKSAATEKNSINALRNFCLHDANTVASIVGTAKQLTGDAFVKILRRVPFKARDYPWISDTDFRTALFSGLFSEKTEKGKISPSELYGNATMSVADWGKVIADLANSLDATLSTGSEWHTFFHSLLVALKNETDTDFSWLDYSFRRVWLELGATLREEALASDLPALRQRLDEIARLQFPTEIYQDYGKWSTEINNKFRESLASSLTADGSRQQGMKRKKLELTNNRSPRGGGGSASSNSSPPNPTANRGKKNSACFAYAKHAAAVPGQVACSRGAQCGFSHSPFSAISAAATLKMFEPLLKRSFPSQPAQDEARRLVTAWATAPGTGFAP